MAITELSMLELLLIVIVRFTLRSMRHPPPVHCRLPLPLRTRLSQLILIALACTLAVILISPLCSKFTALVKLFATLMLHSSPVVVSHSRIPGSAVPMTNRNDIMRSCPCIPVERAITMRFEVPSLYGDQSLVGAASVAALATSAQPRVEAFCVSNHPPNFPCSAACDHQPCSTTSSRGGCLASLFVRAAGLPKSSARCVPVFSVLSSLCIHK